MTQEQEHEILFKEYYNLEEIVVNEGDDYLWDWHYEVYVLLEKMGLLYEYETWKIKKLQKEKSNESKKMV